MKKYDKVRSLDYREQARDKLHVWFGSRDNYYHGFREVCINNTIDEITNNFEKGDIYITLHDDKRTITVKDTGRGMPIHLIEDNDEPYWYMYFQKMFASGKYDLKQDNSGTNGLGGTVTNYTSDFYDVVSCFDGEKWHIRFEDGGNLKVPLENIGKTDEHGTTISFKLEEGCYSSANTIYDEVILKDIIEKASSVSPKCTIHFIYNGEETIYHYDVVLKGYYLSNIESDESKIFELDYKEIETDNEINKLDFIFSKSFKPIQLSFLNKNNLIEQGTIDDGVIEGLKLFINKYAKDNNMLPKGLKNISNNDIQQSVSYMINYNSNNVEYQAQTKFSTKKNLYKVVTKGYIIEQLEYLSIMEKDKFEDLVNHVIEIAKLNNSFKEKKSLGKISVKNIPTPDKLSDCSNKTPRNECEICVVEGDSAGGSAKNSAYKKFQAILPTRGKILNVEKETRERVLANEILRTFGDSIGIPLGTKYNEDDLRYWKIIIMSDADVDGYHIRVLWITFIYRYYRELIEDGHLYISQPPLYKFTYNGKDYYLYSDTELSEKINELGLKKDTLEIQRFKGLGEMDAKQMRETTMNPETRELIKVTIDDCEKIISDLMGKDVEPRKIFIKDNSQLAKNLDI